ncbi:PREDICTED: isoflavone reductase [Prunus dulcis]|uniref:PREDICTED: isoflavone reductase n=1 Tax=Prunus dulcis TaxID=3755 RepID=A0A5E4FMT0_PRUDU|nr:isoeugenol synthase 1-like isoform X1 [Prunus dulcis]VVA28761.1 PREDICTED: isoflavone reductase [Prunus dulcis]
MMACEKSKILIIGATGYLGKYMLKASVSLGHPTYAYVRPIKPKTDSSKLLLHKEFEAMGATIFQGELNDHEKLVKAVEQVDVVISTVAVPQHLEQLKLIKAIKDAGNIKRFIPSEFGNEVDRISGLPPFEALLDNKRKIRRAIEAAGIPYTFVSANSFGAYFVDYLLHPREKTNHQVTVYGTGEAKAVLNYEEDVATYTIKAATDPRVANRVIVYRPQGNIVSQLDLISSWEKKTGCTLTRSYVPEEEILKLSETLPSPDNIAMSILHNIFIKGDQMSFELTENDLEASELYPDYKYTSIDSFLDICLVDPPKPKLAAFE